MFQERFHFPMEALYFGKKFQLIETNKVAFMTVAYAGEIILFLLVRCYYPLRLLIMSLWTQRHSLLRFVFAPYGRYRQDVGAQRLVMV